MKKRILFFLLLFCIGLEVFGQWEIRAIIDDTTFAGSDKRCGYSFEGTAEIMLPDGQKLYPSYNQGAVYSGTNYLPTAFLKKADDVVMPVPESYMCENDTHYIVIESGHPGIGTYNDYNLGYEVVSYIHQKTNDEPDYGSSNEGYWNAYLLINFVPSKKLSVASVPSDICPDEKFTVKITDETLPDLYLENLSWEVKDIDDKWHYIDGSSGKESVEINPVQVNPVEVNSDGLEINKIILPKTDSISYRVVVRNYHLARDFNGIGAGSVKLYKKGPSISFENPQPAKCVNGLDGSIDIELNFSSAIGMSLPDTGTLEITLYETNTTVTEITNYDEHESLGNVSLSYSEFTLKSNSYQRYFATLKGEETQKKDSTFLCFDGKKKYFATFAFSDKTICLPSDAQYSAVIGEATPEELKINPILSIPENTKICHDNDSIEITARVESPIEGHSYSYYFFEEGKDTYDTLIISSEDTATYKGGKAGHIYQVVIKDNCHGLSYNGENIPTDQSDGLKVTNKLELTMSSDLKINEVRVSNPECSNEFGKIDIFIESKSDDVSYYLFKKNADGSISKVKGPITTEKVRGHTFTELSEGEYTVVVTDNCVVGSTISDLTSLPSDPLGIKIREVTITIPNSPSFRISPSPEVVCVGGKYSLSVNITSLGFLETSQKEGKIVVVNTSDSNDVYSEVYDKDNLNQELSININNPKEYGASVTYNVYLQYCDTVSDTISFTLKTPSQKPILNTTTITHVTNCFGNENGNIKASFKISDDDNYTFYQAKLLKFNSKKAKYVLEKIAGFSEGTGNEMSVIFNDLASGDYQIYITDCNSNSVFVDDILNLLVEEPTQLHISNVTSDPTPIYGSRDGKLTFTVNGEGVSNDKGARKLVFTDFPQNYSIEFNSTTGKYEMDKTESGDDVHDLFLDDNSTKSLTFEKMLPGSYTFLLESASDGDCESNSVSHIVGTPENRPSILTGTTREILDRIIVNRPTYGNVDVSTPTGTAKLEFNVDHISYPAKIQLLAKDDTVTLDVSKDQPIALFDGVEAGKDYQIKVFERTDTSYTDYSGYKILPKEDGVDYFQLNRPEELVWSNLVIKETKSGKSISCYGGLAEEIQFEISGGVSTHSVNYNVQIKEASNSKDEWLINTQSSGLVSLSNALPKGSYTVRVTDANGYIKEFEELFTLTEPDPLVLNYEVKNPTCHGFDNGSIAVSLTGGTQGTDGYKISLINSKGTIEEKYFDPSSSTEVVFKKIDTQSGISIGAGTYTIEVEDAAGCNQFYLSEDITQTNYINSATITVGEPEPLVVTRGPQIFGDCIYEHTNGIQLKVSGGTPTVEGKYTVYLPDSASALGIAYYVDGSTVVSNNDGTALGVEGDYPSIRYYDVIVTDTKDCPCDSVDGSNNEITKASDNNDQNESNYTYFTYGVARHPDITLSTNFTNPLCHNANDGSFTVSDITGGNPSTENNYTLQIKRGNQPLSFIQNGTNFTEVEASENDAQLIPYTGDTLNFKGLIDGNYYIYVTYNEDCGGLDEGYISTVTLTHPDPITFSETTWTEPTCYDGIDASVSIKIQGGGSSYYEASLNQQDWFDLDATEVPFTASNEAYKAEFEWDDTTNTLTISKLRGGESYQLSVRDREFYDKTNEDQASYNNGSCEESILLTTPNAKAIEVQSTARTMLSCTDAKDGTASFKVSQGYEDRDYTLKLKASGHEFTPQVKTVQLHQEVSFTDLPSGSYTLELKDEKSCALGDPQTFTIDAPLALSITSVSVVPECGKSKIEIVSTGNPQTYQLSNTATFEPENTTTYEEGSLIIGLVSGSYWLRLKSGNCTSEAYEIQIDNEAFEIEAEGDFEANKAHQLALLCSDTTKTITLKLSAGQDFAVNAYALFSDAEGKQIIGNWQSSNEFEVGVGTHYFRAKSSGDCLSALYRLEVTAPEQIEITQTTQTNTSCELAEDGLFSFVFKGGEAPYQVSLQGEQTYTFENEVKANELLTFSNLKAGEYSLCIRSSNSACEYIYPTRIVIESKDAPSLSIEEVRGDYCGLHNGGGKVNFESDINNYYWYSTLDEAGAQSQELLVDNNGYFENLPSGKYNISATHKETGCSYRTSIKIPEKIGFTFNYITTTPSSSCQGNDGEVELRINKIGNQNEEYTLLSYPEEVLTLAYSDEVNGIFRLSGLTAGVQYVIKIQSSQGCVAEKKISVESIDGFVIKEESVLLPTCTATNGVYHFSMEGGTPPYRIIGELPEGSMFSKLTNIFASEVVEVTGLAASEYNIQIEDSRSCSNILNFTLNAQEESHGDYTITPLAPHCNAADGGLSFEPSNASEYTDYHFLWKDKNGVELSTERTLTNVATGIYYLIVESPNSCSFTKKVTLESSVYLPKILAVETIKSACGLNLGSAEVSSIQNAEGNTTFFWYDDKGVEIRQTNGDITGLKAGNYTVKLIDEKGCESAKYPFTIEDQEVMKLSVTNKTQVSCFNMSDAQITVAVTNGEPPYRFSWDEAPFVEGAFTQTNLAAGKHQVTVLDANNCSATITSNAGLLTVNSPTELYAFAEVIKDLSCVGSSDANLKGSAIGGVAPYSFKWYNKEDVLISSEQNPVNFSEGEYTLVVTDANQICQVRTTVSIMPPSEIILQISNENSPSCYQGNDGSAFVQVTGGQLPYTYLWDNGETTASATKLTTGLHTVIVTDAKGCVGNIEAFIPEKAALTYTYTIESPSCEGGADARISLNVAGGSGGYFIEWLNENSIGTTLDNVGLGTYVFAVTDKNGCYLSDAITLTEEPTELVVSLKEVKSVNCYGGFDGEIQLDIQGGTAPYQVSWEGSRQRGSHITGLVSGIYTALVTDAKGCQTSIAVQVEEPESIQITLTENDIQIPSCFGASDGQITVTVKGGEGPYLFEWSNGLTDRIATGLEAGIYSLKVEDQRGCVATLNNIKLEQPEALKINIIEQAMTSCNGSADGFINLNASGGTAPYVFEWEDGTISATRNDLSVGEYLVKVSDAEGCYIEKTIQIEEPDRLTAEIHTQLTSCVASCDGYAEVIVSGGTAPYTFKWSTNENTAMVNTLCAGVHEVQITDANNCVLVKTITIEEPEALSIQGVEDAYILCTGQELRIAPKGYASYHWTSEKGLNRTGSEIILTEEGTYHLQVSSQAGCIAEKTFTVTYTDTPFETDYVLASEAIVGDTVILVDVTWPIADQIEWIYPDDRGFKVLASDSLHQTALLFNTEGLYEIGMRVRSDFGCTDSVFKWVEVKPYSAIKTTVNQAESQSNILELQAYPNPTSGEVSIKVKLRKAEGISLFLRDILGNTHFEYVENKGETFIKVTWDVTKLPTGIYFLELLTSTDYSTIKLSKE